jgi:hypothetical protein
MTDVLEQIENGECIVKISTKPIMSEEFGCHMSKEINPAEFIDLAKHGKRMQRISVNDRLPELETDVDILDIDNKIYMDAWHIGDGRFLAGDIVFEADEVTHWMPRPPNPKEAE